MNAQDRGSDSHPVYGLVPAKKKNLVLLYAGFFIFYAGYMASSLFTLTACTMAGVNMGFVALYFAAETGATFINLERTGRSYSCVSTSRTTSSIVWFVCGPLVMNFCPFLELCKSNNFGGTWFASWIGWRLLANTAVFALVMAGWKEAEAAAEAADQVRASASFMKAAFAASVGCAVVGILTILANVESKKRHLLYNSRQTAKAFWMSLFRGEPLINSFKTKDGQALPLFMNYHTYYFEKDEVKAWLLRLSVAHALFADDAVFPKEAGRMSNKSHAFFFKDALRRLEFYGDLALSAEIAAHFETMKAALAERKEERAKKKKKGDGKEAGKKVAHVSEEEQLKAKSREEVLELIGKSSTKEELDEIYTSLRKRRNVVT
jgi:hypothetical protein